MSWIDKILGVHHPQQKDEDSEEKAKTVMELEEASVVAMQVIIMRDGSMNMFWSWEDDSEDTAHLTAALLDNLTSGRYAPHIVEVLSKYSKDGVASNVFINTIIKHWVALKSIDSVISPSNVLPHPQHQGHKQ